MVFTKTENNRALILLAGCLMLAYLLPFHFVPFSAFFNEWLAFLGLAIVIAYYAEDQSISVQIPWIAALPLGLAVVIMLQTASGMLSEPWDAFLPVMYLIAAAFAVTLGASVASRERGSIKLCMALAIAHLAAGLISVVIASLQFVGAEAPLEPFFMLMRHVTGAIIRPHANLGQPNQLALLFCISIASVWWLFQVGRMKASVALFLVIALLWGLVLTQSRIGWIILPVFAIAVWIWNGKVGSNPISKIILVGMLFLYAALLIGLPEIAAALDTTTNSVASRLSESQLAGRKALIEQAWKISLAHPWFGAGWFQFGPQQVMGAEFPISEYSRHAHNLILNFAAELGWPITIVVCGAFAFWLFRSCASRSVSTEVAFATLFFLAVLVHSMLEYPLWYAYVLIPFALLVGMVHHERMGSNTLTLSRAPLTALTLVMASALVGIGMDYRRVMAGFNEIEFNAMGLHLDKTAMDKPAFTTFPYVFDYFRFQDMTVHEHMSAEDIAFMERVTKRFGGVLTLTRMSQVYAMNGREDDAVKSAFAVQRLHRNHYSEVYESWRHAPPRYQNVFKRLPPPIAQPQADSPHLQQTGLNLTLHQN